jgi:dipeptidyl aminopeptidase/acylaminoacyl peptidase
VIRDPSQNKNTYKLRAGALDSSETTLVGDIGSGVAFLDSGHLIHVVDGTLMATQFDQNTLQFVGRPLPIANGVRYFMPTGSASFSAARNGTIVFRKREINNSVVWFDADGTGLGTLADRGDFGSVDISPDGEQAALDVKDPRTGTGDIWLYGLNRSTTSKLTVHPAEESRPVWTPAGNAIVFYSDRERLPDIFIKDLDGAGEVKLILGTERLEFNEDMSPDGQHLLYSTMVEDGNLDLWVMTLGDLDSARAFVAAPGTQFFGKFAPDGQLVAYASLEAGRPEVWVKPFPEAGRSVQISTEGGLSSAWARSGRTLYYSYEKKLFFVDLSTPGKLARPQPRLLFETPHTINNFDVADDGRFLTVLRDDSIIEPLNVIVNWSPPQR